MMRQKFPNRRANEIADFEHDGQRFTAAISRLPNGDIGEIFLTCRKYGTALHSHAQDGAILASLAMQNGVSDRDIRATVKGPRNTSTFGEMPASSSTTSVATLPSMILTG